MLRRFLRHRLAVTGLILFLLLGFAAVAAPWLSPYDPYEMDVMAFGAPPSPDHLLGTDSVGRDVLSRVLYASRVSLLVGLGAVTLTS